MAEARQRKHLSVKLELLEEQRDRLSSAVSHRVNKVIQLGRSWLAGKKEDNGKTLSYKEMGDLIEDMDMLLAQQFEQLAGDDQEAFSMETPGDTSTSFPHSTATASQTADIEMLKSAVARIKTLEESLSSLQTSRDLDAANIRKLQNKVRELEKDKNKALKKVENDLQEVSFKYQMVCQIVADRLLPLERLREILNKKVKNSDDNVQKLYAVIQDVASLVPKVSHLENQIQQTITSTVTVTAGVSNITPVKENIIDNWTCNAGNTGGHFDVNTGIFIVPVSGTYAMALSMCQLNKGKIGLYIKKTRSGRNPSVDNDDSVAGAVTDRHDNISCDFSVDEMSAGDMIYVCVWDVGKTPTLAYCRFAIFLVK